LRADVLASLSVRALISPIGSRGDVQPALALAMGLQRRGHEVLFAAPPENRSWVEYHGLRFAAVGADISAALRGRYDDTAGLREVHRFMQEVVDAQFESLATLDDEFDLYVGGGLQCAAQSLAERRGRPYVYLAYSPVMLRSSVHPPTFFSPQRLGPLLNRVLWRLYCILGNRAALHVVNRGRASLGLGPTGDGYRYVFENDQVFVACDPELFPRPPDAGEHVRSVGYLFLEDGASLPTELSAFLEAGDAPIYVGFGSVSLRSVEETDRVLAQVAEQLGRRLVISAGADGLGRSIEGERCFVTGPVNHTLLFPRCAAIVHHGGAGTTAAAARAGVPQLVLPHSADQFYSARRIEVSGLGPRAFAFRRLNVARLAGRLLSTLDDEQTSARARAAGDRITASDGVGAAAVALEALADAGES